MLQSARAELGAATPNKGGHRERAMGLIDQAIAEVRAGIAVRRRLTHFANHIRRRLHEQTDRCRFRFGAMIAGANAMPLAPLAPAPNADVIEVAGGCGPGWHRGPYGGCRRNYANPAAHACPRGWYLGPYGRCRANGT